MNEQIMRSAGFSKEMDRIARKRCPICNVEIRLEDFRDQLSYKEFGISGMCQNCQDKVFENGD